MVILDKQEEELFKNYSKAFVQLEKGDYIHAFIIFENSKNVLI